MNQADLYTAGGALIKTWKGYQPRYTLPTLVAQYLLCLHSPRQMGIR